MTQKKGVLSPSLPITISLTGFSSSEGESLESNNVQVRALQGRCCPSTQLASPGLHGQCWFGLALPLQAFGPRNWHVDGVFPTLVGASDLQLSGCSTLSVRAGASLGHFDVFRGCSRQCLVTVSVEGPSADFVLTRRLCDYLPKGA